MPPAPPQGGQGEGHMGPLWLAVAFVALIVGGWWLAHAYLVAAFFLLKRLEIDLIQYFTSALAHVENYIIITDPAQVTFTKLVEVADDVGYYLRLPVVCILLLGAFILFKRSIAAHYKHVYNMKSLLKLMSTCFAQVSAASAFDLVHQDIDKGPWAMSVPPMRFAKRYKLIKEKHQRKNRFRSVGSGGNVTVSLIRSRAHRVFSMQLGVPWRGSSHLPSHQRALFAAFIAKGMRDSESSRKLLEQLSRSYEVGKPDFKGVDALIAKHENAELVTAALTKHAYVLTVMASLLELARTDGVLSTADFLWLKPIDRRLWYMLNNVGRQTAFVEVAGPYAHWRAECKLGRKLLTPMINPAVDALDGSLADILYDPDREY